MLNCLFIKERKRKKKRKIKEKEKTGASAPRKKTLPDLTTKLFLGSLKV
jgi:hypothetical protein